VLPSRDATLSSRRALSFDVERRELTGHSAHQKPEASQLM
jgi:hypothetical protein